MSDDKEVTTPDDPKVSMMYWHERAMAAEAALASERAKQAGPVHDNRAPVTEPHPLLSATHFCRDCRALWRQCDDFSMNLRSTQCCDKCDNTPVGDQLIPLTEIDAKEGT